MTGFPMLGECVRESGVHDGQHECRKRVHDGQHECRKRVHDGQHECREQHDGQHECREQQGVWKHLSEK
jgi:hypothetical protein